MVPHLITALTGPINELEQRILESMPAVERWFRLEWMEHTRPSTARWTSAMPASSWRRSTPTCTRGLEQPHARDAAAGGAGGDGGDREDLPGPRTCWWCRRTPAALLPEQHRAAAEDLPHGRPERARGLDRPDIKKATTVDLPGGDTVTLEPVVRSKRRLGLKNFDPCTILLNNDLTAGPPGILEDLHEQYLLPPHAGWSVRRKSRHFQSYEEVAKRFGKMLGIDPGWSTRCSTAAASSTSSKRAWTACAPTSMPCQDPQEVQGIRHQREALRDRQGRPRHPRHGHHDRARREGPGRAASAPRTSRPWARPARRSPT